MIMEKGGKTLSTQICVTTCLHYLEVYMIHAAKQPNGRVIAMVLCLMFCHTRGVDGSMLHTARGVGIVHFMSTLTYRDNVSGGELTKAEKRALKRKRKKERKEAEKNRREAAKKRKEREELIQRTLEIRRKMLETEVKSDTVWKNCNVAVLSVDEGLDPEYIERMLRTYLSSIARLIANRESYGECIVDVTVDKDGIPLRSSLLQNSFNNDELVAELEQFFTSRNYGKSSKNKEASLQVVVTREFVQTNNRRLK